MIYFNKIKELFKVSLLKSNLKCTNKNRVFDELDYFDIYLEFLNNSVHFSRFSKIINNHVITGKYLNEKVNTWRKYGIIKMMYNNILNIYKENFKSNKIIHIDGKIITNKNCSENINLGRNIKNKGKNSINLQTVTDNNGIGIGFNILKGSDSEVKNMINVLEKINIEDVNHLKESNKHKKYITADAGYDSSNNHTYLNELGYIPLIWHNKRNNKDINNINNNKLKGHHIDKYKNRYIIETYFSWIDNKIPRLVKIYDKKIINYMNMVYLATIDLIIGRLCV